MSQPKYTIGSFLELDHEDYGNIQAKVLAVSPIQSPSDQWIYFLQYQHMANGDTFTHEAMPEIGIDVQIKKVLMTTQVIDKSTEIVNAILADLTDRRGLEQEWNSIDSDIQEEIKETWRVIIRSHLS